MKRAEVTRINLPKRFLLAGIKFYQYNLSPYKSITHCRFIPTCSEYAAQAIQEHGAFKGSMLAAYRLLRCNPFSKGGLDLVPLKEDKR